MPDRPLILFPTPEKADRESKTPVVIRTKLPPTNRQFNRLQAGKFREAIPYCLFVSFEVAEGFDVDLYTEVTTKIRQRVQIPNN